MGEGKNDHGSLLVFMACVLVTVYFLHTTNITFSLQLKLHTIRQDDNLSPFVNSPFKSLTINIFLLLFTSVSFPSKDWDRRVSSGLELAFTIISSLPHVSFFPPQRWFTDFQFFTMNDQFHQKPLLSVASPLSLSLSI